MKIYYVLLFHWDFLNLFMKNTQQKIFIKFIYLVHYTGLFFYFQTTVASSTPAAELHNAINHATSTGLPPNMDDSQHQQFLQLTSSSTLLQSGGTLLTLDDLTASSSGAAGIPSPMQQHTGQQQKSAENSQSQGSKCTQIVLHQSVILENDFSNSTMYICKSRISSIQNTKKVYEK